MLEEHILNNVDVSISVDSVTPDNIRNGHLELRITRRNDYLVMICPVDKVLVLGNGTQNIIYKSKLIPEQKGATAI